MSGMQCNECGVWVVDIYNHATDHLKEAAENYAKGRFIGVKIPIKFEFTANLITLEQNKKPKEWE